jgi:hypothetical protein
MREQFSMYVLKLKGDLVWQTAGPDKSEDPLEFELEALLSKRATPLLVYGEVHRRIKRTLNVEQLDAFTFAKCLEEFAAEIGLAASRPGLVRQGALERFRSHSALEV